VNKGVLQKSCKINGNAGFSEVIKGKELGGWVEYCDGTTFNTPTYAYGEELLWSKKGLSDSRLLC
jgi:hypothetical protein